MRTKKTAFERILALLLAAVLVVGLAPAISAPAASAVQVTDRFADVSTMDTWKDYFDRGDTAYAGAIWTDKSVFTDGSDFSNVSRLPDGSNTAIRVGQDNFLVALSAIASTSQVTGYSTVPTDTMLVLDVSGSMVSEYVAGYRRERAGNSYRYEEVSAADPETVQAMVSAANDAIYKLLSLNKHNRVGVVLYSGNTVTGSSDTSTGIVLLPLDRYNGVANGSAMEYLSVDLTQQTETLYSRRNQNSYQSMGNVTYATSVAVAVKRGLQTQTNETVIDRSKTVVGGTYIQNGLSLAWDQFEDRINAGDTVIDGGMIQADTKRMPIMVLMSDGAPTTATVNYNNIGTSDAGNGASTHATAAVGFLTQLAASWIRGNMESGYATTPRFYTLGLGDAGTQATGIGVLNPSSISNNASNYWAELLDPRDGTVSLTLPNTGNNNTHTVTVTKRDDTVLTKNYVDQYWYAADTDDMIRAFTQIVDEIILQSKYYATLVSGGEHDIDGYITITDQIGEHMEVKKVTGIVIGNTLYSGAEMAKALSTGELGTVQQPTDLGNQFIWTVQERMGIASVSEAQRLVSDAYNAGQLNPTAGSNYIGWYESANGEYLGHWNESHTEEDYPDNAKYINKSYGYLGESQSSNMMHVVVKVSTNIQNGHQMVTFQIPASLIPLITYSITVEGEALTNANNPKLTSDVATKAPMQLLYEVGLMDEINEVTIADVMAQADHSHPNEEDGSYSFYANRWGMGHAEDLTDPESHTVATAHFRPSEENEYYRFKEAETVLDASGNPVTSLDTSGNTQYYYNRQVVSTTSGTAAQVTNVLMKLSDKDLVHAEKVGSNYVIPRGTVNQPSNDVRIQKEDTTITNTLDYYIYPYGSHDHTSDDFNMYAYLGNNGTFKVTPATGIRLTKTVTQAVNGAPDSFTFTVTLSEAAPNASVTDAQGKALTDWRISADKKVITVALAAGQTVNIIGLPVDATYTVEEIADAYYTASITAASGTVTKQTLIEVAAENAPKAYGSLIIEKDVVHPFGGNLNNRFRFTAVIEGLTQAEANALVLPAGATASFSGNTVTITDIEVADDSSVTIGKIPAKAKYTVVEQFATGFAQDVEDSRNTSGQIPANSSITAQFVNAYTPTAVTPTITVGGTKTLDANAAVTETFTFHVEKYNATTGEYESLAGAMDTVTLVGDPSQAVTGEYQIVLNETYTTVGTHYYRIVEVGGDNENMVYDASQGLFAVTVTDENRDGQLEVSITGRANVTVSGTAVEKDFLNVYSAGATHVDIIIDKSINYNGLTGYNIPLNNFTFTLVNNADAADKHTVTTNADGYAAFRLPITAAGTLTYTLQETEGSLKGMTYDTALRTVTIETTLDETTGKLVSTVKIGNGEATTGSATAEYENNYNVSAVDVSLPATKTLQNLLTNSPKAFNAGDFKLEFIAADDTFKAVGSTWTQVSFDENGAAVIDLLKNCKEVGTFRFIVREANTNVPGVTYDSTEYHITVTTSADDANKTLVAQVEISKVGTGAAEDIRFANTYTATGEASLPVSGTKTLKNRVLEAGEFSFLLKDKATGETLQQVGVHANGAYAFAALNYTAADIGKTFTYQVVENIPADAVNNTKNGITYDPTVHEFTVQVADNGAGGILLRDAQGQAITKVDGLNFTNSYATSLSQAVVISGEKAISGRSQWADDETYTFQLLDAEGNVLAEDTVRKSDKVFSFALTYGYTDQDNNDLGKHYYFVREKDEGRGGITYDGTVYEVEVSVTDMNGAMAAYVTVTRVGAGMVDQDKLNFTNTYTVTAMEQALEGTKELSGRHMVSGESYSFSVYENGQKVASGTSDDTGVIAFDAITYEAPGVHTYVIKEDIPADAVEMDGGWVKDQILYDTTEFTATVTVTDKLDGTLDYAVVYSQPVKFVNTYIPEDIQVVLNVKKTVENKTAAGSIGPNGFQFTLSENGQVIQTKLSDANGDARFNLTFGASDVGEHTYIIRETDTKKTGVTYDDTYFTVTVTVVQDAVTGDLSATYTVAVDDGITQSVNEVEVGFHNIYEKPTTPQTGDTSSMIFVSTVMLMSAAALAALLLLKKKEQKQN